MKNLFGFILVVTRRFSQYQDAPQTQRTINAISMILMLYIIGMLLNIAMLLSHYDLLNVLRGSLTHKEFGEAGGIVFVILSMFALFLLKYTYTEELINYYVDKYKPANDAEDSKQKKMVLIFILGGFVSLGSSVFFDMLLN